MHRFSADVRREQILSASIEVLAKSNYQKMRLPDVADSVGISEAAIYKYYPTKKRLFLAVLKYMSKSLINSLTSVVETETDPIKALHKAVTAFVSPEINPPDHVRIRAKAIAEVDDIDIATQLQHDHLTFVLLLRGIVENGLSKGVFRSDLNADDIVLLLDATGMFVETLKLVSLEGNASGEAGLRLMNLTIELVRS